MDIDKLFAPDRLSKAEKLQQYTEAFKAHFPHAFQFNGITVNLITSDVPGADSSEEETFHQIHAFSQPKKRRFPWQSAERPGYLGEITLKFSQPPNQIEPKVEIMGNYNKTYGTQKHVKGIVGATIVEIIKTTGQELEVSGLTNEGKKLYERLASKPIDGITVTEIRDQAFRLSPASKA